jgi:hypothetical protein
MDFRKLMQEERRHAMERKRAESLDKEGSFSSTVTHNQRNETSEMDEEDSNNMQEWRLR